MSKKSNVKLKLNRKPLNDFISESFNEFVAKEGFEYDCPKCGTTFQLTKGSNACPSCGATIEVEVRPPRL